MPTIARPGRRRLLWLIAAITLIVFAIYEVVVHDLGPVPIVAFALLPDLAFLVGAGQPRRRGQLQPRTVPAYNVAHRPIVPIALIVVAVAALLAVRLAISEPVEFEAARHLPLLVYVAGITWLAHIALDRAAGFGLRTPDGWQRSD